MVNVASGEDVSRIIYGTYQSLDEAGLTCLGKVGGPQVLSLEGQKDMARHLRNRD